MEWVAQEEVGDEVWEETEVQVLWGFLKFLAWKINGGVWISPTL